MTTLTAGDYFGEIALLHDVPRTATCTAQTDAEVYALARDVFVATVSGDVRSSAEAESVIGRRLEELDTTDRSGVVGDRPPGEQAREEQQDRS
jgi:CRP-like cAMP-binding protein